MKKVLIIAQGGLNRGGIQTVFMNYVYNLHDRFKFDIVLFTNEVRDYDEEFVSYGGKIFRIFFNNDCSRIGRQKDKFFRATKGYMQLLRIMKENGPYDIVHCHNGIESATALKAAMKANIKKRITQAHVVFDDHTNNVFFRLKNKYQKLKICKYSTLQIGCSDIACRTSFIGDYKVILNPYNEVIYKRADYEEPKFETPILIQVGNLSDLKNQIFSVRILKELLYFYPKSKLRIIGPEIGGYKNDLLEVINKLNLAENIELYSSDANIAFLLSNSSYLLQPSRTESFAIVLVEAQAMGLRCFASDVIPNEANAGGVTYLSINGDPFVWAKLIANDFNKTKGSHAFYDCSKYRSRNIAKEIENIYNT